MPSERATCRTLSTGTPGMLISIALPFLCWLSLATPRLTTAERSAASVKLTS